MSEKRVPSWPEVEQFLIKWENNFRASGEKAYLEAVQEAHEVFSACFGGSMPDQSEAEIEESPDVRRLEFLAGERASPHETGLRSLMLARAARGERRK